MDEVDADAVADPEADPEATEFEVGETAAVDSVDSGAVLVDVSDASVDRDVDSLAADLDSVDAGADELSTPLVTPAELNVPPNGAFGLTLLSVFEAAV